jgi:hypothetical protein
MCLATNLAPGFAARAIDRVVIVTQDGDLFPALAIAALTDVSKKRFTLITPNERAASVVRKHPYLRKAGVEIQQGGW